jgi:hypothetical protein
MVEFWKMEKAEWTGNAAVPMLDVIDYYDLLEERDLLPDFIATFGSEGLPSENKVIAFYARYGPLQDSISREGREVPRWVERLDPERRKDLPREVWERWCEPLWQAREQALELELTYEVAAGLREGNLEFLRSILGEVPQGKVIASAYLVAGRVVRDLLDEEDVQRKGAGSFSVEHDQASDPLPERRLRPLTDEETLHFARMLLCEQLNAAEGRSRREWVARERILGGSVAGKVGPEGTSPANRLGLVRVRSVQGLTAAIYLQISELVEEGVALRSCSNCRRLFYAGRTDQIYCTAGCGDAARQRGYYAATKQSEQQAAASASKRKGAKKKR